MKETKSVEPVLIEPKTEAPPVPALVMAKSIELLQEEPPVLKAREYIEPFVSQELLKLLFVRAAQANIGNNNPEPEILKTNDSQANKPKQNSNPLSQ